MKESNIYMQKLIDYSTCSNTLIVNVQHPILYLGLVSAGYLRAVHVWFAMTLTIYSIIYLYCLTITNNLLQFHRI